jgi:hypothetical protein
MMRLIRRWDEAGRGSLQSIFRASLPVSPRPAHSLHLLHADLLPVLLVIPHTAEGIEVLVEIEDVS